MVAGGAEAGRVVTASARNPRARSEPSSIMHECGRTPMFTLHETTIYCVVRFLTFDRGGPVPQRSDDDDMRHSRLQHHQVRSVCAAGKERPASPAPFHSRIAVHLLLRCLLRRRETNEAGVAAAPRPLSSVQRFPAFQFFVRL
ncbi:hypothetical protein ACJJTC_019750 [Scirpophaga incertulas]